jgi:hypothetical protein
MAAEYDHRMNGVNRPSLLAYIRRLHHEIGIIHMDEELGSFFTACSALGLPGIAALKGVRSMKFAQINDEGIEVKRNEW